jgi:5-formyltetrahydrofolate cyclo-ligase
MSQSQAPQINQQFQQKLQQQRQKLRKSCRQRRRAINSAQQSVASQKLFELLNQHPLFIHSHKIAFYMATDGEISPDLLLRHALSEGKNVFLPFLSKTGIEKMSFYQYKRDDRLVSNRFNILEPDPLEAKQTSPASLDLVFLPLVAFDTKGNRLGMGKGYYDKSFRFIQGGAKKVPKLIGLAHECQRVEELQVASWDVPLEKIVTGEKIYDVL